jgi:rhodanese-related sulfurtransferase
VKSIDSKELRQWVENNKDFQLIDVREPDEHEEFNIGGELVPLGEIASHLEKIDKGKPVVLYCRKGIRSQFAIQKLQDKFPFNNLYNLIGGVEAWRKMER